MVDGEGCFSISISRQHEHSLKLSLRFEISIKLGDWSSVATDLLASRGIPFHTHKRKNQFQVTVNGNRAVKRLIEILLPHLVIKKPLAKRLLTFPVAPSRNRFSKINGVWLGEISAIVDFVRIFNSGKSRPYKWDGNLVRAFYQE